MNATVHERAIVFGCEGEPLVGIVHAPRAGQPSTDLGVVIIVGGPQYRAGSHRQFVLLARTLATAGYPVLRFDYRGMGDSGGAARSFEQVNHDIAAAIDTLQRQLPSVQRVVLWGLCDGASAALLYANATHDARVSGACVLNPWVRSDATLATTQLKHYYTRRLLAPQFWAKLLRGKVASGAMFEVMQKMRLATTGKDGAPATEPNAMSQAGFQQRMAQGWQHLGERILLILSGNDYTAKEFIEHAGTDRTWRELLAQPGLQRHALPHADHTFSDEPSRRAVEGLTIAWLNRHVAAAGA
jgi:exosortase A-associated hydrolase 1